MRACVRKSKPAWRSTLARPELVALGLVLASLWVVVPVRADDDDDDSSWSDRIGDTVKRTFSGAGKAIGIGNKPDGPPPVESPSGCPPISILDGTNAQRVMAAGVSGNQGVRYQYTLSTVGRQCSIGGGRVSIKVAADGSVLLGPAGTAGQFEVPIRVVVFSETQQKPVTSKLYRVPASMAAGQSMAPFRFLSDDITVPTSGNAMAEYSIKVGIDAGKGGGEATAAKKPRHHRAKPVASAAAQ